MFVYKWGSFSFCSRCSLEGRFCFHFKRAYCRSTRSLLPPHTGCPRGDPGLLPVLLSKPSHRNLRVELYTIIKESPMRLKRWCWFSLVRAKRCPAITGAELGEQRRTNTEPEADRGPRRGSRAGVVVATGSRCDIHNRITCKEICNQPPPGRYSIYERAPQR